MARSKLAVSATVHVIPSEQSAPIAAESAQPVHGRNPGAEPRMRLLAHPFIVKNANLGGSKVHLQFSRQANEIQIRFGADSNQDMLSDAIHDLIKSHKVEAENGTEVNLFHWNENDRAWGMRMDRMSPATSRQKAAQVFAEVNKLVADEHGTGPANSRFMSVLRHSLHGLANQTIST